MYLHPTTCCFLQCVTFLAVSTTILPTAVGREPHVAVKSSLNWPAVVWVALGDWCLAAPSEWGAERVRTALRIG